MRRDGRRWPRALSALLACAGSMGMAADATAPLPSAPSATAMPAATVPSAGAPALADAGAVTCAGRLGGAPFWARLLPRDPSYGNHRVLQVVYTPPTAADLGGAALSDCPFVLLDDQAQVVAWNGRESESQVVPALSGYRVTRELAATAASDAPGSDRRVVPGGRGFDLRLAPLEIALCWRAGQAARVRVVDLFGPRWREPLAAAWTDSRVDLAGTAATVEAGGDGRLRRLVAADGTVVIAIDAWAVAAPGAAPIAVPVPALSASAAASATAAMPADSVSAPASAAVSAAAAAVP
jgi:hypothetical protein